MKAFLQKASGILVNRASDGPWRSKSVLAALLAVVVGVGFWCADFKNNLSPGGTEAAVTNAPGAASPGLAGAPVNPRSSQAKPFPFYARWGVSYVAGYCLGWFFRKLTRLIIVVTALVIALLAYGKLAGCDLTRTQEKVKRGGKWAQQETTTVEKYLKHLLPSAAAGGVGTVLGFRRRGQTAQPKPVDQNGG